MTPLSESANKRWLHFWRLVRAAAQDLEERKKAQQGAESVPEAPPTNGKSPAGQGEA